ncbi:hypothetical protein N665_0721s0011 [Sinapis alba]|nr:hypothetical protein N665_0721s0011 [Sinapis alba]
MESSRAREFGTSGSEPNEVALSKMMFAEGEEPVGVRVLTYQSSRSINTILDALEEDEIQYLIGTSFGEIVEIAEKPGFSGRFARYLLYRQLKIEKKQKAWFRFSGKPIRFSIREFAIVTGLPCDMRVSRAVKMACLAIVSSVLLSTNLKMKMLKEHAQLLGDIDEFLAFPWGRMAFDMLMDSIKKHDKVSLSKNTIALKGFSLALHLVIVEAVPSLTEVVQESCSSSKSDSDEEDNDSIRIKTKKQTLSHAHTREVDRKAEAIVRCIIPSDPQQPIDESILTRLDEVPDIKVDNLLKLVNANHCFVKTMFTGGLTKLEVDRLRVKENVASTIQPDITRIDAYVMATVVSMLLSFRNEMMALVSKASHLVIYRKSRPTREDANDEIINKIIEYSTPPTSDQACPVMDILIRLIRGTFKKQAPTKTDRTCQFLDARFASMLGRCYPKFKKAKSKNDYMFSKGLAGCILMPTSHHNMPTRFYFPFNVDNRHWIGLCIDWPASKIYVLDCNPTVRSYVSLSTELRAIADLFLHLLKFSGRIATVDGINLSVDRVKGVAQNTNTADAGLPAALLMQTHAMFGADTCRCITPFVLPEEAQRAAVMLYEFKQVL